VCGVIIALSDRLPGHETLSSETDHPLMFKLTSRIVSEL